MAHRLLVCGDRNYTDWQRIQKEIKKLADTEGVEVIIQGGASGADHAAALAAKFFKIPCEEYPAQWRKFGRAAGPIRNAQMLSEGNPSLIYAFHDWLEGSKGTKDMVEKGRRAGIKVVVFGKEEKK